MNAFDPGELWLLSHEEQMQAARAEFIRWWAPLRRDLLAEGISFWTLARLEQNSWELFLTAHNLDAKHCEFMAFNPSPTVAAAREVARKFKKKQVIILMIDEDTLELATYGETTTLCAAAKTLGDAAYKAVMKAYADCERMASKPI